MSTATAGAVGTTDHSYTISEVVELTGFTAHTLRWYERIGLLPEVDRSVTGQRRYRANDLEWISFLGHLRTTGMPVAQMVEYAKLVWQGDETVPARRALLVAHREQVKAQIAELTRCLDVLDYKIDVIYADGAS